MSEITGLVVVLKSITVVLGGLITFFAYRAYRRTNATPLRWLSIGFATITLGAMLGGFIDQLLRMTREWALVMESSLAVVGFAVILYSLYAK
jgi:energy-converting hydrogenase Eha subunit F